MIHLHGRPALVGGAVGTTQPHTQTPLARRPPRKLSHSYPIHACIHVRREPRTDNVTHATMPPLCSAPRRLRPPENKGGGAAHSLPGVLGGLRPQEVARKVDIDPSLEGEVSVDTPTQAADPSSRSPSPP